MLMLQRVIAAIAALSLMSLLAACGGGSGAGAQGTGGGGTGGGGVAALDLKTNSPSVDSDGRDLATITAFVKDASNRAMANQQVDFSTSDTGSVLQIVAARTDASGVATATLRINDPTNRTVSVVATTGDLSKTVSVAVVGTTVTVNGPSSVVANAPTEFTVSLRDSAGSVLAGRPVTVSSSAGNTLSASTVVTDAAGQTRFTLTGTRAGTDTITVSTLGASATATVTVSSTQIVFGVPTASQEIVVATPQDVVVTYSVGGAVQAGQSIQFTATRGTLNPTSAITDGNGRATVSISAATAGVGTITAVAGSVVSSQRVEFVSRTPSKLNLQASPANVGVNLSPTTSNSSQLIAVVRDAADNPVKGQTVAFTAVADPSNGRIEPAIATTDSAGVATVAFFPGANSSGFNQVEMKAEVVGTTVSGTARLTASRQELMVRTGTGDVLPALDIATYTMPWTVVVSDASGNPVPGAVVQASLVGTGFYKGDYVQDTRTSPPRWVTSPPYFCSGEDLDGNLRLDAGEDFNGDGKLTPGNVAVALVTSPGGLTDANGLARVEVIYPKEYGNWVAVRLRVTITTVAGTEGADTRNFVLPITVQAVTAPQPPFPGHSPFGRLAGCDNAN